MPRAMLPRALTAAALALVIGGGCGPEEPTVADAPPYVPPDEVAAPPKKGAGGEQYEYGANSDYQKAMQQMNDNMR